jgi:hypothetical protein
MSTSLRAATKSTTKLNSPTNTKHHHKSHHKSKNDQSGTKRGVLDSGDLRFWFPPSSTALSTSAVRPLSMYDFELSSIGTSDSTLPFTNHLLNRMGGRGCCSKYMHAAFP